MSIWDGVGYHIVEQPIDTTFAVRRRETLFYRSFARSVRAYAPSAAVHVDWYQNTSDLPLDKIWYKKHLSEKWVNHWM
jgi:hypothetical protein